MNGDIPRVAIDGIYGEETSEAVRIFQTIYGLKADGLVDRATFDMLFIMYRDVIMDIRSSDYIITDIGFPLKVGNQSNDVIALHLIILELGKTYNDIGVVSQSAYFSESTKNAVMNMQKIFRLPVTGEVDSLLYDRMIYELDAIRRLNQIYI
jgi:peptidoglycan hydrolase-like protein with peptidoglycan-binding domain